MKPEPTKPSPDFITVERTAEKLRILYKPRSGVVICFIGAGFGWLSIYPLIEKDGYIGGIFSFFAGAAFFLLGMFNLLNNSIFEVSIPEPDKLEPFRGAQNQSKVLVCYSTIVGQKKGVYTSESLQELQCSYEKRTSEICQIKAIYKDQRVELITDKMQNMEAAQYVARLLTTELISNQPQETMPR
jgi:hypothetical protein